MSILETPTNAPSRRDVSLLSDDVRDGDIFAHDVAVLLRQDRVRRAWAIGLNLIAPGTGLVILRREWYGLAVAAVFAVIAQVVAYATIVDPTFLRADQSRVFVGAAVVIWCLSQVVVLIRCRRVLSARAQIAASALVRQASESLGKNRYGDAIERIRAALSINDESIELWVTLARLYTLAGRFDDARMAWERVLDLDVLGRHESEAVTSLDRLPTEHGSSSA